MFDPNFGNSYIVLNSSISLILKESQLDANKGFPRNQLPKLSSKSKQSFQRVAM